MPMMIPHTSPEIHAAKVRMRAEAMVCRRGARRAADAAVAVTADAAVAVAERLAGWAAALRVPAGTVVAGYWPLGDEIDPLPLMGALAAAGCRLALPEVTAKGQPLLFRAWAAGDPLVPGPHGTAHPPVSAAVMIPGVVLLPMLAFDRHGFRLGYGGGYYDRTLDLLRSRSQVNAIGVAYAAQEVAMVPHDGHDQRLDRVVTELGPMDVET